MTQLQLSSRPAYAHKPAATGHPPRDSSSSSYKKDRLAIATATFLDIMNVNYALTRRAVSALSDKLR